MTIVMLAAACGTDNSEDLAAEAAEAKQMITVLEDIRDELATAKEEREEIAAAKDALAESNSDLERKLAQLEESLEEKEALIELLMERSDNDFEELVSLIEEGESLLEEDGKGVWEPKFKALISSCEHNMSTLDCAMSVGAYDSALEKALSTWDDEMPLLHARLLSLNLSSEHADASRARDTYLKHLNLWRDQLAEESFHFPSMDSFQADQGALEAWAEWVMNVDFEEINDTHDGTCTGLGNSQPKDDSYRERIIDICDD